MKPQNTPCKPNKARKQSQRATDAPSGIWNALFLKVLLGDFRLVKPSYCISN